MRRLKTQELQTIGIERATQAWLAIEQLLSITAFHGRIFWEDVTHPDGLRMWAMAVEALAGLIVEGTFIAVLIQRLSIK